jgi:hypothetical protein
MTVKELITVLSSANPDAEVVIMDEDDYLNGEESAAYKAEDILFGLFDDQVQTFTGDNQIDNEERETFGQEAVCILISEA